MQANLFIVGAMKAGTTSIYDILAGHNDIYMSMIKEPNFFFKDLDVDKISNVYKRIHQVNFFKDKCTLKKMHFAYIYKKACYDKLFENRKERYLGESSISYLYSKEAAKEIFEYNQNAKIIICLRSPVERAFSQYKMNLRLGLATKCFTEEFFQDYNLSVKHWANAHLYYELGLYSEQIKRYTDVFPKSQIKIILFDDIRQGKDNIIEELSEFLGVNSELFNFEEKKSNVSETPKNKKLNFVLQQTGLMQVIIKTFPSELKEKIKTVFYSKDNNPKLSDSEFYEVFPLYENEINKMQEILNRNLDGWKKNSYSSSVASF